MPELADPGGRCDLRRTVTNGRIAVYDPERAADGAWLQYDGPLAGVIA